MIATNLNESSVSVLSTANNQNFRRAYINSLNGRKELESEMPPEIVAEVLEVWGSTPTVPDYIPEDLPPSPPHQTTEERITTLATGIAGAQQTITSLDLALIAVEQANTNHDLRLLALEAAP